MSFMDCIQPWLEDKRQDECPSCRSTLIVNHKKEESNATTTTTTTTTEKEEENQIDDEDFEDDDENDPEEGSFFVIIHGLISRVAQQASYALVNTKNLRDEHNLSDASSIPCHPPFSDIRQGLLHCREAPVNHRSMKQIWIG